MVYIFYAYFNFDKNYNIDNFRSQMDIYYHKYEKIKLIIDLEDREVGLSDLTKFKQLKRIFDDDQLGVEKLVDTNIICKNGFKKKIIKGFIKIIPTKRPVNFY